jgi:hypothetical protein
MMQCSYQRRRAAGYALETKELRNVRGNANRRISLQQCGRNVTTPTVECICMMLKANDERQKNPPSSAPLPNCQKNRQGFTSQRAGIIP